MASPKYEGPAFHTARDFGTSLVALEMGKDGILAQHLDAFLFSMAEANIADADVVAALNSAIEAIENKRPEDIITGTVELTIKEIEEN